MDSDFVAQKPLLAVGLSLAYEINNSLADEQKQILEKSLESFLLNRSTFYECAQIFQSVMGSTKPVDRLSTILQTTEMPIPNWFSYGSSNNADRKKTRSWTEYEDQRLLAGIHRFGLENWQNVALFVGNSRTRAQCSQRWVRGLDPRISKDRWTPEDEALLSELVDKYGNKAWTKIATEMGNRSDVQCRYHYKQMLNGIVTPADRSKLTISQSFPASLMIPKNPAPQPETSNEKVALPSIDSFMADVKEQQTKLKPAASFQTLPITIAKQ